MASLPLKAQDATPLIKRYLLDNQQKMQLSREEASDGWIISDQYLTQHNQVTHVYVQQMVNGLKLFNAVSSAAVKNGVVAVFNSRFTPKASLMANAAAGAEQVSAQEAVKRAAEAVQIPLLNLRGTAENTTTKELVFAADGIVKEPIKVFPLYQKTAESIRLAWNVEIRAKSDWWQIRVDALTGAVLEKNNYTVYCDFNPDAYKHIDGAADLRPAIDNTSAAAANATASYRVIPFPGESPIHANWELASDPADPVASPLGWHDTDGQAGADYTITRGNNVYATEDRDDNNEPGYSPDGGPELIFDFPYTPTQPPLAWEDAAITNLFYANNFMHDMAYRHGFDEAAGNFQENNYGQGGEQGDAVQADAQDGSGTNNANFSTPDDGQNGRMQMYIWTGGGTGDSIIVNAPIPISGIYNAPIGGFGPVVATPITGDVVLIEDNTPPTTDGCETIVNGAQLSGKIVMIDRGSCVFPSKVQAAQDNGAIAVVVVNNASGAAFGMPGTSTTINIPSVMISQADGQTLRDQLANGVVNITILPTVGRNDRDSDVDNGIIAHEYGHGISNRLTGGPSNSGCLGNAEQMGEGWSDFYSLITTIHPTDTRLTVRSIGAYAVGEAPDGAGIRNQLYSTDMSVNTYTYGDLPGTQGAVHNIGELWATMLWDLTWDLIDLYGFEPDLMASNGGNNIAQRLVTDGFKLQPCGPGFVDGRDAILQADQLNNNGANRCIIWNAFARRGLGYSASQGSSSNISDGTEAFDIPPFCQIAVSAPIAAFTVDRTISCLDLATFKFTDQSQNIAQYWLWDFGDGNTSDAVNPTHTYTAPGAYTVTLMVTNNIAVDTLVQTNYISVVVLPTPTTAGATVCAGQSASLTATLGTPGNTAEWTDENGNILFTGTTFNTPALTTSTTYSVNEAENTTLEKVGPLNFGAGGNHNTTFIGQILFTAEKSFLIKSAFVRAQGAGDRNIRLFDATGDVIASVTVNIPDGESRITLNLKVPGPGNFSLGAGPMVNLYRNNLGTVYPFNLAGLVTITGSNAGQEGFYYYFYDWEVQETPCRSASTDVAVAVIPGPLANFSSSANGLTATFTDASTGSPTSWLWSFGDGATSTLPNPAHTYAATIVYNVVLVVSNGTCSNTFTQTLDFTTGTTNLNSDLFDVQLSPNPATESVNLSLSGTPGSRSIQIGLYSVDGRLVQNRMFDTAQGSVIQLDLSGLAAGLYIVKVEAAAGLVIKKLVVK